MQYVLITIQFRLITFIQVIAFSNETKNVYSKFNVTEIFFLTLLFSKLFCYVPIINFSINPPSYDLNLLA